MFLIKSVQAFNRKYTKTLLNEGFETNCYEMFVKHFQNKHIQKMPINAV